jgi:hypothetical protein
VVFALLPFSPPFTQGFPETVAVRNHTHNGPPAPEARPEPPFGDDHLIRGRNPGVPVHGGHQEAGLLQVPHPYDLGELAQGAELDEAAAPA